MGLQLQASMPLCAASDLLGRQHPEMSELAAAVGGFLSRQTFGSKQVQKPISSLQAMGWAMEGDCISYHSVKPRAQSLLSVAFANTM